MAVVLKRLIHSKGLNTIGSKTTMADNLRTLQAEDLADFNVLVLAHQNRLYNQAYYLMGDHAAAEDATQEAIILAYTKFHTYRGGSLVGWLLTIVTNLCLDELRQRKRRPILPLEPVDSSGDVLESPKWLADPAESPEEAAERGDIRAVLQAGINCLPPKYRSALVLVDIQRLHYAEAAEVMGCPIGTMKSRLARARWLLRVNLNKIYQFA